jgi:quercetin dioxygenase-like cupin family protein
MSIRTSRKALVFVGALAGISALMTAPVFAGECAADKRVANARQSGPMAPQGVTDTVLATIDLGKEKVGLKNHQLRIRRLVIAPGGVVPWHSHDARPALIMVLQGEIHEYASNCAGPIVHKPGDVARETKGISHWWKNLSGETVILTSSDIFSDPADKHM